MGRYDLGLSEEEFWRLTPRQLDALLKRRLLEVNPESAMTQEEMLAAKAAQRLEERIRSRKRRR